MQETFLRIKTQPITDIAPVHQHEIDPFSLQCFERGRRMRMLFHELNHVHVEMIGVHGLDQWHEMEEFGLTDE